MLCIFIDTNVLLHGVEWRIHIEELLDKIIVQKYKVMVHELVLEELYEALDTKGKLQLLAKLALQLLDRYDLYEDQHEYPGTDIALLETARREKGAVLTFDKELMHRCKNAGVPVLYLVGKRKLKLIGYVHGS